MAKRKLMLYEVRPLDAAGQRVPGDRIIELTDDEPRELQFRQLAFEGRPEIVSYYTHLMRPEETRKWQRAEARAALWGRVVGHVMANVPPALGFGTMAELTATVGMIGEPGLQSELGQV